MSIVQEWEGRTPTYTPTCDVCGKQLVTQYVFMDAVNAKKNAKWKSKKIDDMWFDICDECQLSEMYESK